MTKIVGYHVTFGGNPVKFTGRWYIAPRKYGFDLMVEITYRTGWFTTSLFPKTHTRFVDSEYLHIEEVYEYDIQTCGQCFRRVGNE